MVDALHLKQREYYVVYSYPTRVSLSLGATQHPPMNYNLVVSEFLRLVHELSESYQLDSKVNQEKYDQKLCRFLSQRR